MNDIAQYRVIQKLGSGGMGSVYLATDTRLGRKAAVKVLNSDLLNEPSARLRFQREAMSIASLGHPNIAVLYEIGECAGQPFLAMEYVEGQSLSERTAFGPVTLRDFVQYSSEIAEALGHAHARGVIHRDIKPSNIMVAADGRVKLLDFGLAQLVTSGANSQTTKLTQPGGWVGTLQYASPEVLAGRVADQRSDIYSLGVVMYELATGKLPFGNLSGYALVTAILHGQIVPLAQYNPTFPPALAQCIERAMATAPHDRFSKAAELGEAIRTASSQDTKAALSSAPVASVAILEFVNLSHDPNVDWLAVGIAETVAADLTKLDQLRVIPADRINGKRVSSEVDPTKLASDAGASFAFSGSYQRAGNRIRITPRLIETATGKLLYSGKIDGDWERIFELQDRVVKELVEALQVNVESSSMERLLAPVTAHLEAYEHFSEGRKSFTRLGKSSLEDAKQHLEKALALDANYAVAHSALGSVYAMRYIHRTDPADLIRAAAHLEKALELDSELAEPHVYLAYVYARQGEFTAALREGKMAVQRQPDLGKAHYFLGAALVFNGEQELQFQQAAVHELIACVEVDRNWTAAWTVLASLAIVAGEPDLANEYLDRQAQIELESEVPRFPGKEMLRGAALLQSRNYVAGLRAYGESLRKLESIDFMYRDAFLALSCCGAADIHLRLGHPELALPEYRRGYQVMRESRMLGGDRVLTRTIAGMASAYAATGDILKARQLAEDAFERLQRVLAEAHTWIWETFAAQLCYRVAETYLAIGDRERAISLLKVAINKGWRDSKCLENDPVLESLHCDSEFAAVVAASRDLPRLKFPLHDTHHDEDQGRTVNL